MIDDLYSGAWYSMNFAGTVYLILFISIEKNVIPRYLEVSVVGTSPSDIM